MDLSLSRLAPSDQVRVTVLSYFILPYVGEAITESVPKDILAAFCYQICAHFSQAI